MPAGAAPGERRGGRAKGTPNKATEAKRGAEAKALDEAFLLLGPSLVKGMSPARVMRYAMETLLLAGFSQAALVYAEKVAPYFDAKLAPLIVEPPQEAEEERARRLHEAMRKMRATVGEQPVAEDAAASNTTRLDESERFS